MIDPKCYRYLGVGGILEKGLLLAIAAIDARMRLEGILCFFSLSGCLGRAPQRDLKFNCNRYVPPTPLFVLLCLFDPPYQDIDIKVSQTLTLINILFVCWINCSFEIPSGLPASDGASLDSKFPLKFVNT